VTIIGTHHRSGNILDDHMRAGTAGSLRMSGHGSLERAAEF